MSKSGRKQLEGDVSTSGPKGHPFSMPELGSQAVRLASRSGTSKLVRVRMSWSIPAQFFLVAVPNVAPKNGSGVYAEGRF